MRFVSLLLLRMNPLLPASFPVLTAVLLPLCLAASAGAADRVHDQLSLSYYLPAGADYRSSVPTPEAFFGFQVGEWHLRSDQIAAYFRALEQASDRLVLQTYAFSHQRRPLLHAVLTSAANHARLEEIRRNHLMLSDPAASGRLPLEDMPVVVCLGYSVHGNEPSGANASVLVAYHLAAAQGAEIEELLERTVILLDPCLNPDGLDRFANWANGHRGQNLVADSNHREHREGWPSGRTNHYWFDLNRDWLPAVHPESRGRLERYHAWRPNILTDHHEMGTNNTFFFQPGIPSRNNPSVPQETYDLTALIAEYHARSFDRKGVLYYSEESYDDFYIGKASAYPDLNGGIGILFEQASSRGHLQQSDHGLLSFPYTIRNQVAVSFSTLEAARDLRVVLLEHQRTFYRTAAATAAPVRAYVVGTGADPVAAWYLRDLLALHGIEVRELARPVAVAGRTFGPGEAFLIPADQPQARLVTEMMQVRTEFIDNLFYDVSTWTLPFGFGLEFAVLGQAEFAPGLVGPVAPVPPFPEGRLETAAGEAYAYIFSWTGYHAPRALHRIQQAGARAYVATRPFHAWTAGGERAFDYGSIVIPVLGPPAEREALREVVAMAAAADGIQIFAATTGLTPAGIDLGSPSLVALTPPRIAIVTGEGVSPLEAGDAWYVLDQRMGMAPSLVDIPVLNRIDLAPYNRLVFADGSYGDVSAATIEKIKRWVRGGGIVIAIGRAGEWAARHDIATAEFFSAPEPAEGSAAQRIPYADAARTEGLKLISGAIFAGEVDLTHPLGYGYSRPQIALFRTRRAFLRPSKSPYQTPILYAQQPLLSGYVSDENLQTLAGSAAALVSPLGSGRVFLFPDNPNFRGYWLSGHKLFMNAIFFGPVVRTFGSAEE